MRRLEEKETLGIYTSKTFALFCEEFVQLLKIISIQDERATSGCVSKETKSTVQASGRCRASAQEKTGGRKQSRGCQTNHYS